MPERSRTSRIGHILVLLPQSPLFVMWRHNVIPCDVILWYHMSSHHRACHSDFLVCLPQNPLFVMWRHNVTSRDVILWCHMSSHHRACHSDLTRDLLVVLNKYVIKFNLVTLTFGLRPWPTILALPRLGSTTIPKIKVIGQTVWTGECTETDTYTVLILWP